MLKRILLQFILFSTIFRDSLAGYISGWDIAVEYNYNGNANKIILIFLLETGLPADKYIQVSSPIGLGVASCNF